MNSGPTQSGGKENERGMFLRGLRRRWGLRRIRNYLLLGLGLWFLYVLTLSDQGIVRIIRLKNRIEQGEKDITALEAEQDSLQSELSGLENNLDLVEKHAREELGMVKPGEVVYKLVPGREESEETGKDRGKIPDREDK